MKGADKASSGQGAQTVYRDKKGRKLDMLNEFMKSQDARAGKLVGALGRGRSAVCPCVCDGNIPARWGGWQPVLGPPWDAGKRTEVFLPLCFCFQDPLLRHRSTRHCFTWVFL